MTENQMGAEEAARQVGNTVADQAGYVTRETKEQARHVVADVRERVAAEAEEQALRVSKQLGRIADELGEMAGAAPSSSMSAGAIRSVADTSRQAARFLDERGAQGLLDSARDYARRKPGTFLLGAAVAGFLVGRVAKSATGAGQGQHQGQHQGQSRQGGVVPATAERRDVPTPTTPDYAAPVTSEYGAPAPSRYDTPEQGTPLTPSASPAAPAAGVPHVEP